MELAPYFKSIVEQDRCAVVVCGVDHTILYLNPAAVRQYAKWGGAALAGKSLLDCHNAQSCKMIQKVVDWFGESAGNNCVYTHHNPKQNKDVYMVALRDDNARLIGYYEKHEYRTAETARPYDLRQQED